MGFTSAMADLLSGAALGVEHRHERLGGDHTVGLLTDRRDLVPIDAAVEPHADPSAAADVRRPEEALRLGLHQLLLHARRRRAPQVWEVVGVMAVLPVRHERRPVSYEPG